MVALEINREKLREDARTVFQYLLVVTGTLFGIGIFALLELHRAQLPRIVVRVLEVFPYLLFGAYAMYWVKDRYTVEETAGTLNMDD